MISKEQTIEALIKIIRFDMDYIMLSSFSDNLVSHNEDHIKTVKNMLEELGVNYE